MAKQSIPKLVLSFTASGAVSAMRAVAFSGAQATVEGQKVMGVSPRQVAAGRISDAVVSGTTVIETGGAFAVGDGLIVDDEGRAIAATGGQDPEYEFADALETSGGAGEFVEVLLRR